MFLESVRAHPHKIAVTWHDTDGVETARWSYKELYDKTRVILYHLKNTYKLKLGDRALLVYEPCLEFFPAFWACALLGVIAVPVCPPDPFALSGDALDKLTTINQDAQPEIILTSHRFKDSLSTAKLIDPVPYDLPQNQVVNFSKHLWVATDTLSFIPDGEFELQFDSIQLALSQELLDTPAEKQTPELKRILSNNTIKTYPMFNKTSAEYFLSPVTQFDVAFLQYTSGSTGVAKGVVVHNRNVQVNAFNCALLTQGLGHTDHYQWGIGLSWLPTFHDMGLVGFHITPMLIGGTIAYQSPIDFITNPVVWLKLISRFNKVFSGAPPFALSLLAKRTTPEDLKTIDLSSLSALVLGAEPIRASFLEEFTKFFGPYGFRAQTFITCFGMAENVLHVSGKWGSCYHTQRLRVDSKDFSKHKLTILEDNDPVTNKTTTYPQEAAHGGDDDDGPQDSQWIVSSGEVIPFHTKQTLDAEINDVENLPKRLPHFARREHASYIIVVDPNTREELPDGSIGELWILSASRTAGYWKKAELSAEQFHATLAKPTKDSTRAMIEWLQNDLPKIYTQGSHIDPLLSGVPVEETMAQLTPCTATLAISTSLYSVEPTTQKLVPKSFDQVKKLSPKDITPEFLRTGDMGVIHNNNLYITGRIKDMIILRGQNFYADDLEHTVSNENEVDKIPKNNTAATTTTIAQSEATQTTTTTTSATSPTATGGRPPALDFIRPGHCVAYSIEIATTTNAKQAEAVRASGAEGEHLCLIVELTSDLIDAFDDEDGDNDNTTTTVDGDKKITTDGKEQNAEEKKEATLKVNKEKSGNQQPYWQQFLMKYSEYIVGGVSELETGDLDRAKRREHDHENQQPQSCPQQFGLYARQALFTAVRYGLAAHNYFNGNQSEDDAPQTATTEKKQDDKKQDDKKTTEQTQLSNEKQYQPLSKQAAYLKTKYTTRKLNTVSAAIRKVIAAKYLLPVDKIIFVTPRTIRKTTSGKKSRAITVRLAEDHYLDHRIIAIHNSKALETYYQLLKEAGLDVAEGVKNNQQASTLSSNDKLVITSDKKND